MRLLAPVGIASDRDHSRPNERQHGHDLNLRSASLHVLAPFRGGGLWIGRLAL
jgi:hypothetical protein